VRFIEYGHLLTKQSLEEGDEIADFVNHKSMIVTEGWAEPCARNLAEDTLLQFERRAYFRVDKRLQKGDDKDVTLECVLIPDGKTKAMTSTKGQMDAKEQAQGAGGENKKEKKADNKKADKMAATGGEDKGPSKNDLKKAEKKLKKDALKADHKAGTEKPAPTADAKAEARPKAEKKAPKSDAKKEASNSTQAKKVTVADSKPLAEFALDSDAGLTAIESHLKNSSYCSGKAVPGKADADLLEAIEKAKFTPDVNTHPYVFAWWWALASFSTPARELWE
jgi:hypothetical protein